MITHLHRDMHTLTRTDNIPFYPKRYYILCTQKLAKYFGVKSRVGAGGFEACGSPGEVANDQKMGHRYFFPTEEQDEYDWAPLRDSHDPVDGKVMVWTNVVMKAEDQLRQRMAWALSQIFVLSESGADSQKDVGVVVALVAIHSLIVVINILS